MLRVCWLEDALQVEQHQYLKDLWRVGDSEKKQTTVSLHACLYRGRAEQFLLISMPGSLSERCERYRVQRDDAEAKLDKLDHTVCQLRTESQRQIRHLERQVKDAEVDQRRLKNQVKAAEVSQRQLRRNNQTLERDATQWRRFVNEWEEPNERFYARVSSVSAEPGETALSARVAQRMVDALKNRVVLLEKAQDQTAHEYEEVKEVAQGLKRMRHQERANSAMLVHSLQEGLAQERDARELAVQD